MDLRYKTVLFDFDGTVIDSGPGIFRCLDEVIEREGLGKISETARRRFIGPPLSLSFMEAFGVSRERADELVDLYRVIHRENEAMLDGYIYDGIEPLLQRLNDAGAVCAVASAKREETVVKTLEKLGKTHYFKVIAGAPGSRELADKPAIMRDCVARLGVVADDGMLMIGDSDYDADGAEVLGIDFCGVMWGYGFDAAEDVEKFKHVYIAQTVADLEKFLFCE